MKKIVYKPRSVQLEIILEQTLETVSDVPIARPILDCKDHGHDSFIDGYTLDPLKPSLLVNYITCFK